ncbi:MAG TPA: hypothetical protein VJ044_18425 [Candidatus Hodarchaeales archaeon]|nr:hypothetical protein [Candidatus Hodarchaeales archaeon]
MKYADDESIRKLDQMFDIDAEVTLVTARQSISIVIQDSRNIHVEERIRYQYSGILFLQANSVAEVSEQDFRKLSKATATFIDTTELATRLNIRRAGNYVWDLLHESRPSLYHTEGYKVVEAQFGLPPIDRLAALTSQELAELKDRLKELARQNPSTSKIRIKGVSIFAQFFTNEGRQILPPVEPYVTCEAYHFKEALEHYARTDQKS